MYNPLPYLPNRFQKLISFLKEKKTNSKLVFLVLGLLATIWFLIRVIPKPSRANYPCMQATAPFMSGFIVYLLSLGGAVIALKRFREYFYKSKFAFSFLFLIFATFLLLSSNLFLQTNIFANKDYKNINSFTPNTPIGVAQGIFPGRVTWMWDPDATNENCTNTSNNNGVIDAGDNGWYMNSNNNELVIDSMVIKSIKAIAGDTSNVQAWNKIFNYFNVKNGHGNIGYTSGQKILLKINCTSAYGGLADLRFYSDLSRNDNLSINPFAAETNPYIVLSMLRQLVNVAQVPQNMIYIGDPARNIYKELYDLWHSEFPNVNYLGNNLIHSEIDIAGNGRTPVVVTTNDKVFFSDHGSVMTQAVTDKLFTIYEDIDYLINIPTMKAHSSGGITLAAKNHFGSFTRQWALHLHDGLMGGYDGPTRLGYGLYRVQTDIMMHNLLSGKNLLIVIDALYPSNDAQGVPSKWFSLPFQNDWCSSIFMSLDPVAIESVCHDFLRTEYNGPTIAESRPNWFGVDDYLHQASDSSLWPDNITYDPDNDGVLIPSLGVHEHWNDSLLKQYTRNLGTGIGIELYKVHEGGLEIVEINQVNVSVFPNPTNDFITISNSENKKITFSFLTLTGKVLFTGTINKETDKQFDLTNFENGIYLLTVNESNKKLRLKIIKK
ncbi:MAG: DUF362 domain-containing protein [Bacteroidia bacterium]|nr:DUF362 domain-containing protein [Bacteroidia bacterium]